MHENKINCLDESDIKKSTSLQRLYLRLNSELVRYRSFSQACLEIVEHDNKTLIKIIVFIVVFCT